MEGVRLTYDEQRAYAESAAMLRWTPDENGSSTVPVTWDQVIRPRRHEDNTNQLWNVFNRAQENLINGGNHYVGNRPNGQIRHMTTRPVRGIDGSVNLNRALWALAERMRELKSA
jgi:hypothetical protein